MADEQAVRADGVEQVEPSPVPGEVAVLQAALRAQRAHVLGILEGLDEEQLRQPVLPSGWSPLGLLHHLALDVELFWFRAVVSGEQAALDQLAAATQEAWLVPEGISAGAVLDQYRSQSATADAVIARTAADSAPAWWPVELFGDFRLHSLREVLVHVLTETACHAGHLDAVRELLDGRQWLVLTG